MRRAEIVIVNDGQGWISYVFDQDWCRFSSELQEERDQADLAAREWCSEKGYACDPD